MAAFPAPEVYRCGARILCGIGGSGRWVTPQQPDLLAVAPERGDRVGHGGVLRAAVHVDVEEVAAKAPLARPRLDPGQVHAAERELAQAAHEPARGLIAGAGEEDGRLPRAGAGRGRRRG